MIKTGRVYKIIANTGDDVYVGSTFNTLKDRMKKHRSCYAEWKKGKGGKFAVYDMFEKYGVDHCKMVLIKEYQVVAETIRDKKHLSVYEQLWINKTNCINIQNSFQIKHLYDKKYRKENREIVNERKRIYKQNNQEKVRAQDAAYRENNREKCRESNKNYYMRNRDKILQKEREKVLCECGSELRKSDMSKHIKTKKHQEFINPVN